jgi:hypothetical protein
MTGFLTTEMLSDEASMSHLAKMSGVHLLGDMVHPSGAGSPP